MALQVISTPRKRGFICLNAHPAGCEAALKEQIAVAQAGLEGSLEGKNILIIGSSTGFGLSTMVCSSLVLGANVYGVCFEKPSDERRGGSAGWYNICAARKIAAEQGRTLNFLNADAFSHEAKAQVIADLQEKYGKLDYIIYSLASPKRKDPNSDTLWSSVLKPIGQPFIGKNINLRDETIDEVNIEIANEDEIMQTQKVMGGEDWKMWIEALIAADLLNEGCLNLAYSYIGPQVTKRLYRDGTIGKAKQHLESTATELHKLIKTHCNGRSLISVNKALVTQASAAIPVVTLYTGILYKVMKEAGTHEGCIEQIVRLFKDHIGPNADISTDDAGRIRIDDQELDADIQKKVDDIWPTVTTENLRQTTDYDGFELAFNNLFGFDVDGVDYTAETETSVEL